ncbi:MAG: transcriptional regulator NrdR [Deltaproteobacteria bacterium]|jgi:transcriptional repressor NrdR|nr:transcriptional regulator NrdR [Deltaproteobacteria bacterium]
MKCPYCGKLDNKVLDSRLSRENSAIRRRRVCTACNHRFTTYERVEEQTPMLIKNDGRREAYNRSKLKKGIMMAAQKRPIAVSTIDAFIDELERKLQEANYKEIPTREIGERVVDFLKKLDPVAYIRFVSVYKNYTLEDFEREVKGLHLVNTHRGPEGSQGHLKQ